MTRPPKLYTGADALGLNEIPVDAVRRAIQWVNRDGAPRDECFMSTRLEQSYTYGSGRGERTYWPVRYPELILAIRQTVRDVVINDFGEYLPEACFANLYTDQHKHLGWHADDSPSIDHRFGIAVVTFVEPGSEREIWYREKSPPFGWPSPNGLEMGRAAVVAAGGDPTTRKVLLPNGSVFFMPPGFQQTHEHRIPKASRAVGARVSLTFRKLV